MWPQFFISISAILFSCSADQKSIEEKALEILFNSLNNSSNYEKYDSLDFGGNLSAHLKLFASGNIYSNENTCMLTTVPEFFDPMTVGNKRINQEAFFEYRDSLSRSEFQLIYLKNKPVEFSSLKFSEFQKVGEKNDHYFLVRHHLIGYDRQIVEINYIPFGEMSDPFKYTFHLFFDKKDLFLNMEFSSWGDFEYNIDC